MIKNYLANFEDVWTSGLLVFDTSSLLRIYEWHIDKALELKDVLRWKINDIWIPHQVNVEVLNNKSGVESQNKYLSIIEKIEQNPIKWNKIHKMLKRWEENGYEHEFKSMVLEMQNSGVTPEKLQELKNIADRLRTAHHHKLSIDSVYDEVFSNIGDPFSDYETQNLLIEFDQSPNAPGNRDRKKHNSNSHGDFFVWKQMIKKSLISSQDIIFVTNDVKEDWFSNKELHIPREELLEEFFDETNNRIIIVSLTSFLEQCSVYLNEDISGLIAYSNIQDEIRELFDNWYPDMLVDKINKFLEDDTTIKDEMETVLETCIDTVSFEGVNDQHFNLDDSDIDLDGSVITFHSHVDITTDFDGNAHNSNEDFNLGTASVELRVWLDIFVEKQWESEDSNRISLCNQTENIEIVEIEFLGAYSDFGEVACDDMELDYDDEF